MYNIEVYIAPEYVQMEVENPDFADDDQKESDDDDWCHECRCYGDDYYFDDDGELQSFCDDCPANHYLHDD